MKSKDKVMNDAMSDFDGQIPSVRLSMKSRFNGVWENGYCHGFARGVKVGNADVQNKLDVIEEIKQGEFNRGYNEGLTATMSDDTAIKYLHMSGWLPDHDREIGTAAYKRGYIAGVEHEKQNPFFTAEQTEDIKKLEEAAYRKCYENADDVLTNLSAAEALFAVHEYGKRKAEKESGKPEKPDLKVGDCVLDGSGNFCTITQIGTHIHVMYPSGKTHKWSKGAKFRYVGRSFNTDLEAMKRKMEQAMCEAACVNYWILHRYVCSGRRFYAWHISELVIYEKPKELSDFRMVNTECLRHGEDGVPVCEKGNLCQICQVRRPPQSWCYVVRSF